jgi:hypothetical protein
MEIVVGDGKSSALEVFHDLLRCYYHFVFLHVKLCKKKGIHRRFSTCIQDLE